jgi:hypothetical protein
MWNGGTVKVHPAYKGALTDENVRDIVTDIR